MEKNKSRLRFNILMLVIVLVLIVVAVVLVVRFYKNHPVEEKEETNETALKNVGYNTSVEHWGYLDAKGISTNFIEAFNTLDGAKLASMMDLPAEYIYDYIKYEVEQEGTALDVDQETTKRFDAKYEEVMKNPKEFKDFVLMQYEMEKKEQEIITAMPEDAVTITLLNEPEIEDVTEYLSRIILKLNVKSDTVDEDDTMELRLLHRGGSYYLMNYFLRESVEK